MTNELDTLRPEVQKALDDLSYFLTGTHNHDDFYTIRTELLRLAQERDNLAIKFGDIGRVAKNALDRAERAEAELAAFKARIAGAPTLVYGRDDWRHEALIGKRVRLVVEE